MALRDSGTFVWQARHLVDIDVALARQAWLSGSGGTLGPGRFYCRGALCGRRGVW